MPNKVMSTAIVILAAVITLNAATFTVNEANQVLVVQFGKIQGDAITKAGLHWKLPFVQEVRYFDKRILSWDGDEEQITTKDKKYIWVDTTARWRIVDIVKFAKTLHNEREAQGRLDNVLDGITRDTISSYNLVEAVRNTNEIIERIETRKKERKEKESRGEVLIEEEISGEIEPIVAGREKLSQQIAKRATEDLLRFGIELIDVQLRRIAYEKSVETKVYERMISERKRIAEKIRSIGKGEEAKIRGKLNKDLKKIESVAYRKSKEIKGKAQNESIGISAASFGRDPGYYQFRRTLDAYKKALPGRTNLILSTDSEFLKLLEKS